MAIVLVLSALALLSFMVVAILSMARTEDRSAKASAEIIDVRGLAELPTQLVIAQIRRATADLGTQFTWASQPGMIRVYSNSGTDGQSRAPLFVAFKLYSSDRMALQGSEFQPFKEAEKLRGWEQLPSIFTDLNSPIPVRPIQRVGGSAPNATENDVQLIYPILDPEALGLVDGFEINQETVPSATENQPVPMPAAWLYVLRDGQVISPVNGDAQKASFRAGQATVTNPIVGRIAFWTDDESCKLNLNTASEPAPWDAPRANSRTDHSHAEYQPARNEYHRQSGHPAFTALSPVFRSFGKGVGSGTAMNALEPVPEPAGIANVGQFGNNSGSDAERYKDYLESNHQLLPRTADRTTGQAQDRGSSHGTRTPTDPERLKGNRLFSSIDELLFDSMRQPQVVTGDGLAGGITLRPEDVRRARFFLTTRSSAPELNPFNRPKISLWPVQRLNAFRSELDKRMCIAGTFAGHAYYWQRDSVWSGENSPGSSQNSRDDAALPRNQQIVGYLQELSDLSVPGYGNSFLSKYGEQNRDHLLLSMFDLVRSGVNIENQREQDGDARFQYLPPSVRTGTLPAVGEYSAVPLAMASGDNGPVKSYGKFPTVTEFAIVLVATDAEKNPIGSGPYVVDPNDPELAAKTTKVRAFIILEPFLPTVGQPASSPAVRYRIKGLETLTLGGVPLGFPAAGANGPLTNRCTYSASTVSGTGQLGGNASAFNGLASQFLTTEGIAKSLGNAEDSQFPFVSAEITLSPAAEGDQKKQLVGGALTLEIHPGIGPVDDDAPLQKIELTFPTVEVPVPRMKLPVVEGEGDLRLISPRFALKAEAGQLRQELIVKGDVVRSMELSAIGPSGGDYRILAALPQVSRITGATQEFFAPVWLDPRHVSQNQREAHTLRSGAYTTGGQFGADWQKGERQSNQQVSGFLLPGTPSPSLTLPFPHPAAAPGQNGARNFQNRLGDWDNGPGLIEDGPYVSRSDFGNQRVEQESQISPNKPGSYFGRGGPFLSDEQGLTTTPLRQMSSAIAFGSLPTGVYGDPNGGDQPELPRPWQTLLFCPNPPSRQSAPGVALTPEDHFGFSGVPDHQWLEFFWMPATEPRPLSVALATEGKVNLNHQIMPFTYIRRATAMHGALQGVRITAYHQSTTADLASASHPKTPNPSQPSLLEFRYPVNAFETLRGMDEDRFNQGDIFRSTAEICETFLVPKRAGEPDRPGAASVNSGHDYGTATATTGLTRAAMLDWWNGSGEQAGFQPTGDNTRESPYAQLYPRLCTRSNVYQVHYKVQFLRKSRSTAPDVWDEAKDRVAAEQRGSATFERYLDATDTTQPDYVTELNAIRAVDDEYRYRIIQRQPFAP